VRKRYEEIIARRDAVVPLRVRRQMMSWFWDLDLWQNMYWFGIPVLKSPSDMWMMQQVVAEVRPDYLIEAGTSYGGSALYFAHVFAGLGLSDARVITIDIHDKTAEVSRHALWQKHVEFVHGSSTDPAVVSSIAERVKDSKVMVVLDSNHSRNHVLSELEAYAPLVNPGSYIVVEDTSLDAIPLVRMTGRGPMAAVEEFLGTSAGESFQPDLAREIFLVTFHPGGWLRRVR
jgi:cephalosporin hydroxylase